VLHAGDGSVHVALGLWGAIGAIALLGWAWQLTVGAPPAAEHEAPGARSLWRNRLAWQLTLFLGIQSALYFGALSWLPQIYQDRGVTDSYAGVLLLVMGIAGVAGTIVAPVVADRMRDQRLAVTITAVVTVVGLVGVLVAPTGSAMVWVVLLGLTQGAALALGLLLIVLRSADHRTAAQLSSMCQAAGYVIAALGPLVMGLLHTATGGWTVPLLFLLAMTLAAWPPGLSAARDAVV
jgi:CP family cyanate transporter-like MFS transporter